MSKRILEQGTNLNSLIEEPCAVVVHQGFLRAVLLSADGRELTLFRIKPTETCISFMASKKIDFTIIAEVFTELEFIRPEIVERQVLISAYKNIEQNLFSLAESLGFLRFDERLAQYLGFKCIAGIDRIPVTHQDLADHVGSTREMVSRTLKEWETLGLLTLSRGFIVMKSGFREKFAYLARH